MTHDIEHGFVATWWQFAKERFDPPSHFVMLAMFIAAHYVVFVHVAGMAAGPVPWRMALLSVGVVAFFFKLRLYDEIKDYEVDCRINRDRPLVRGLVTHTDLYRGIALCITLELMTFGALGTAALGAMAFAVAYSLLMYKEFFIRDVIRPHLTTYAVMHTIVCSFLSVAVFTAMDGRMPWLLPRGLLYFAANCWFLFNIFEFGRKTFNSAEERENVESYSHIFGRFGAVALVLAMAAASTWLLLATPLARGAVLAPTIGAFVVILLVSGGAYALMDRPPYGKVYRAMSSVYIVLVLGGILTLHFLDKL